VPGFQEIVGSSGIENSFRKLPGSHRASTGK